MAERLNEIDIALDFRDLKKIAREIIAPLDHAFLNDIFPFTEKNPSSENIAKWIYDSLKKKINDESSEWRRSRSGSRTRPQRLTMKNDLRGGCSPR